MDGYAVLELNAEQTQVFATIYPPDPGGNSVQVEDILERLHQMGVLYGIRKAEIARAIRYAEETGRPVTRVVVAQGVLPVDGTDAQKFWRVDQEIISRPMPRRTDGLPDYFAYEPERMVKAGQPLVDIIAARVGTPGRTLIAPLRSVPQKAGRASTLTAGPGVHLSEDRLHFSAAVEGFLELRGDKLLIHALQRIEEDLPYGSHTFPQGVIVLGNWRGGHIRAYGTVAIRGTVGGGVIRTTGDVFLCRVARSRIITEGNVYITDTLLHCEVNTRQKIIALDNASIIGGSLTATAGLEAASLGSPDQTLTRVLVGVDQISRLRSQEIEEEIRTCESNIQKIGQSIRPLTLGGTQTLPQSKKELVQRLVDQRRELENRIRDLHSEKRLLMVTGKTQVVGEVNVRGTVYPGVQITIHNAELLITDTRQGICVGMSSDSREVEIRSLSSSRAA